MAESRSRVSVMDALIDRAVRGVLGPEEGALLRSTWEDFKTAFAVQASLHRDVENELANLDVRQRAS